MRAKPVDPNAIIRDPHTRQPLPAEGADVPDNSYWERRWLDGEILRRVGDRWERRLPSGQVVSVPDDGGLVRATEPVSPIAVPPVAPLTTRGGH